MAESRSCIENSKGRSNGRLRNVVLDIIELFDFPQSKGIHNDFVIMIEHIHKSALAHRK